MEKENSKEEKKKGFFAKLFETLDKKLADKAKKPGPCCGAKNDNGTDSLLSQNKGNQCRPSRHPQKENKDLGGDSCCG
jgi:hypothetical protein